DGKRIKKIVPSAVAPFNDEVIVFVYDTGGKLVAEYATLISQDPKVSYTTADHLGSPRILTDENGATISRRDFHPFGEEILTTHRHPDLGYTPDDVRQKFTSYERDDEVDLDFAQARYYDYSHGRFASPDNFANDTHPTDPASWNLFAYVRNNPLYFVDPNGEKVYVGNIANQDDRDEFLRRANFTYGCESCVTVDTDGYLQIDTTGLSQEIINATQFLTDAINSTDPAQLYDGQMTTNDPDVAFGEAQRGMGNVSVAMADGTSQEMSSMRIRLDVGDDAYIIGDGQLQESFLNLVFGHE